MSALVFLALGVVLVLEQDCVYGKSHATVCEFRIILHFRDLAPKEHAHQTAGWEPTQDNILDYRRTAVNDACATNARCHVTHDGACLSGIGDSSGLGACRFPRSETAYYPGRGCGLSGKGTPAGDGHA
jgi:hypothetical protein